MLRDDVRPEAVILAVTNAIEATFDHGKWLDLALRTGTSDVVGAHPRLLRSLNFGDDDYRGNIIEIVPAVLGRKQPSGPVPGEVEFTNFNIVEKFLDLSEWLYKHDPELCAELYGGPVPLEALQKAATQLGFTDVDEHAIRIRRGLHDDPAQAIGSSKELLETVLKSILGLHGIGKATKLDVPELLKRANVFLGLDAAGVRGSDPGAEQRRKALGSLAQVVIATAELRNAGFGTGHGVSQRPGLDIATARLVVAAAVAVATFYLEANAAAHP